jgi:hypothetical protein
MNRLNRIFNELTEHEKVLASAGIFPARLMNNFLEAKESAELIRMAQKETGVKL